MFMGKSEAKKELAEHIGSKNSGGRGTKEKD